VDKRSTSTNRTAHCQHQRNEQHAPVAAEEIEGKAEEVHFLNHLKPWFINYCKAPAINAQSISNFVAMIIVPLPDWLLANVA
jgi:hypothetical protein